MKYIKTYENNQKLKVGDYILIGSSGDNIDYESNYEMYLFEKFIKKNICKIIKILYYGMIVVQYSNIPKELKKYFNNENGTVLLNRENFIRMATPEEILEYEMNKNVNKYNL